MTNLTELLSRIGETAPERSSDSPFGWQEYASSLESLVARLAARVERAEAKRCARCNGSGWFTSGHAESDFVIACKACNGTGREPKQ